MKNRLQIVLLSAALCGCTTPPVTEPQTDLVVSIKAETLPEASDYKTYFLIGSGETDFASVRWQKLRPMITKALAAKGFIEVVGTKDTDLAISLLSYSKTDKTLQTYTTPNIIYKPSQTANATSVTSTIKGPVLTTTTINIPGQIIDAGETTHSYDKYYATGCVRLTAAACKEWHAQGDKNKKPRHIWRSTALFYSDAPVNDEQMIERLLEVAIVHAATDYALDKTYQKPEEFIISLHP